MKRIGILSKSISIRASIIEFYGRLGPDYDITIITTQFFNRDSVSFQRHYRNHQGSAEARYLHLHPKNIDMFLSNVSTFDCLVILSGQYHLIHMLIIYFARKNNVRVFDHQLAFSKFKTVAPKHRIFAKKAKNLLDIRFIRAARAALKYKPRLLSFYLTSYHPYLPNSFKKPIPAEFRADRVLMFLETYRKNYRKLGYQEIDLKVIGPKDRLKDPSEKNYVLFVDSFTIGRVFSVEFFLDLVGQIKKQGFDVYYAPHPNTFASMSVCVLEKIKGSVDLFAQIGETERYMRDAHSIITVGASSFYVALLAQKKIYFLTNAKLREVHPAFYEIQQHLSEIAGVPLIEECSERNAEDIDFKKYTKVDYWEGIRQLFGSDFRSEIAPEDFLRDLILSRPEQYPTC